MARWKTRERDFQRGKVYRSERQLSERLSQYGGRLETIPEITDWVNKINESRWLQNYLRKEQERYGGDWIWKARLFVKDGRGRSSACFQRSGGMKYEGELKFPKRLRSRLIVLHELAHAYTNWIRPAAHGREFCANYLLFVRRWLGKDAHADLKASFDRNGVKYRRSGKWKARKQKPVRTRDNWSYVDVVTGR